MDNSVLYYFNLFFTYGIDSKVVDLVLSVSTPNKRLALEAFLAYVAED